MPNNAPSCRSYSSLPGPAERRWPGPPLAVGPRRLSRGPRWLYPHWAIRAAMRATSSWRWCLRALAAAITSSWLASSSVSHSMMHLLVTRLKANTRMPQCRATTISATVLMPGGCGDQVRSEELRAKFTCQCGTTCSVQCALPSGHKLTSPY